MLYSVGITMGLGASAISRRRVANESFVPSKAVAWASIEAGCRPIGKVKAFTEEIKGDGAIFHRASLPLTLKEKYETGAPVYRPMFRIKAGGAFYRE